MRNIISKAQVTKRNIKHWNTLTTVIYCTPLKRIHFFIFSLNNYNGLNSYPLKQYCIDLNWGGEINKYINFLRILQLYYPLSPVVSELCVYYVGRYNGKLND